MTYSKFTTICNKITKFALLAMLAVVPLVFYTKTHDVFEFNKLTAFRIFTLTAFLAYMTKLILVGGVKFKRSPMFAPVLLVGITSLLSTLWSNNTLTSIFGVYEDFEGILTIVNYMLLWFLVHQTTLNGQDIRKYMIVIIAAGTVATGYGIAQNFGIDFIRWNPNTYSANRMFGSLGNPNFLAAYALMSLPIALMYFLTTQKKRSKVLFLVAAITMVTAIFFTKSRGAFYALVAEGGLFSAYLVYDKWKKGKLIEQNRKWLIVFGLLAVMTLLAPQVRHTVATTVKRTLQTLDVASIKITPRLYIWRSSLQMMLDKPLVGNGLDTFQITFPKYRLPLYWQLEWNGTPEKAHNFFLQIGATTGFLGLGAWLWMLVTYFAIVFWQMRYLSGRRRHLAIAIAVAQVGFLVQNLFSFTVIAYGSLFWFLLALGPTLSRQQVENEKDSEINWESLPLKTWSLYVVISGIILTTMFFAMRSWAADIFFKRGIIYLTRGYVDRALPELQQAVMINPLREIYWVKYGIANEEMSKRAVDKKQKLALLQKAADIHKHTIGMNDLNGYDYNNLGRVYKYWGDYIDAKKLEEAEKVCKAAVERDPYNVYFSMDLASIHISLKRWDEVEKTIDRLIKLFPDFAMSYSYKGYVALMRGDLNSAENYFEKAAKKNWRGDVNTRASTLSNLGIVRARKNKLDGALAALTEAVKVKPYYTEARMNRGMVLERLGRFDQALKEYRYIVKKSPNHPRVGEMKQKIDQLERRSK